MMEYMFAVYTYIIDNWLFFNNIIILFIKLTRVK